MLSIGIDVLEGLYVLSPVLESTRALVPCSLFLVARFCTHLSHRVGLPFCLGMELALIVIDISQVLALIIRVKAFSIYSWRFRPLGFAGEVNRQDPEG